MNFLILVTLGWSLRKRSLVGMLLAGILLASGIATLWTASGKIALSIPPNPVPLSLTGLGALFVNVSCAFIVAAFGKDASSLTRAAYLSGRNDAIANIAIIAPGIATVATAWVWPDVIVGLGIFAMNLDAAREVFVPAEAEHASLKM